jgi:hypothetical protein
MPIYALRAKVVNELDYTFMVFTDKDEADRKCDECNADLGRINDEADDSEQLIKKWFTHYYGGCGEIYKGTVKVVELHPGVPFASFDLD